MHLTSLRRPYFTHQRPYSLTRPLRGPSVSHTKVSLLSMIETDACPYVNTKILLPDIYKYNEPPHHLSAARSCPLQNYYKVSQ